MLLESYHAYVVVCAANASYIRRRRSRSRIWPHLQTLSARFSSPLPRSVNSLCLTCTMVREIVPGRTIDCSTRGSHALRNPSVARHFKSYVARHDAEKLEGQLEASRRPLADAEAALLPPVSSWVHQRPALTAPRRTSWTPACATLVGPMAASKADCHDMFLGPLQRPHAAIPAASPAGPAITLRASQLHAEHETVLPRKGRHRRCRLSIDRGQGDKSTSRAARR